MFMIIYIIIILTKVIIRKVNIYIMQLMELCICIICIMMPIKLKIV